MPSEWRTVDCKLTHVEYDDAFRIYRNVYEIKEYNQHTKQYRFREERGSARGFNAGTRNALPGRDSHDT